ncbi:hypothetical protein LJ737_13500 [Hymenobacter sp. 15J16-1T3B]|uniref:hypothetical protein n=1 Tax=Hymenobacter sp. 15J16-1T3B TaxID=2886941 RepID=UPI001D109C9B|nr:hypothetical protein [Hymenobacter sp. 15J16-1T3B]MCC3158258.1 hypothetical protein [Hymenobacter sp. 15J16-1T3B]
MSFLFHQNMRRYGGGSRPRRDAYNSPFGGFAIINGGLPAPLPAIAVAGFTEITNNRSSRAALATSCEVLGGMVAGPAPALVPIGNVACGITALAHGPEYIYLARNTNYPLVTVGRILFQTGRGGVQLLHQRAATAAALNNLRLPPTASADFRGLVYCVVTTPAGNIAVGFLHNLYTFLANRTIVAGQLGGMMAMMGQGIGTLPAVAPAPVARYIGGDFNVAPISPRGGYTAYSTSAPGGSYPAGAAGVGTTYSGSLYDYWYSDVTGLAVPPGLIVPVPVASTATLDSGPGALAAGLARRMSDHTATLLQIS